MVNGDTLGRDVGGVGFASTGVPTGMVTVLLMNAFCAMYSGLIRLFVALEGTTICTLYVP